MYKVLSTRISVVDLASSIQLCEKINLRPTGQSAAATKALGFLLENLRQSGELPSNSVEDSLEIIEARFSNRDVGTLKLNISLKDRAQQLNRQAISGGPLHASTHPGLVAYPTSANPPTPSGDFAGIFKTPLSQHELSSQFDDALAEDVKLYKQLEEENLLDSIMVVEHRGDDEGVELVDPTTMNQPTEEEVK